MKIEMQKHQMTRIVDSGAIERLKAAGWIVKSQPTEQAGEEIIRLKPPVKAKATVRALEEANANLEGDE